jgi:type IX secretion system PorP/SprF family membrane protein
MRNALCFTIALLFSLLQLNSQTPEFNNTQHSLVYMNPSFSGSNGFIRNQTVYRNQWPNLSGTYVFYNTVVDGYIKSINGGISLSAFSDNVARGLIKQNKLSLAYAQYFHRDEIDFIPSVQLSYGFNNLIKSQMSFPYTAYPSYGLPTTFTALPVGQVSYFDAAVGFLISDRFNCVGVSLSNLLQPNISFAGTYKVPVRLVIHSSTNKALSQKAKFNLMVMYVGQNNNSMMNFKIINTYDDRFIWGAGYKIYMDINPTFKEVVTGYNDISFYLGLRRNAFTFCYSYDFNSAKLYGNTVGSHEISFSWSLTKKDGPKVFNKLENK